MKKTAHERVTDLNRSAISHEDFMSQLGGLDTGEVSKETLSKIDGGKNVLSASDLLSPGMVYGMYIPPKDIFVIKQTTL